MFSLHDIVTFVTVAECGSVRQAAASLGRTQPAISQAVQRLEDMLGFALLDRTGYRVALSEQGELFLARAQSFLQQADNLKDYAGVLARGSEARLRISVHAPIPAHAWVHLVRHIPREFPDTVLEVEVTEDDTVLRPLMAGDGDLAIMIRSPLDNFVMQVERQQLGSVNFVNVVHSDHLVPGSEAVLDNLPQIRLGHFNEADPPYGIAEGHRYWRVSNHRAKADVIIAGLGWGAVPDWMIARDLADGSLCPVAYKGFPSHSSHPFFLCHRRDTPPGPVAMSIWKLASSTSRKCADNIQSL